MTACPAEPRLATSTSRRTAGGRSHGRLATGAGLPPATRRTRHMSMPWILRHPILRLLLTLVFIWAFAFGLTIPFLTLTARDRGVSLDAIGVIAASFLLT